MTIPQSLCKAVVEGRLIPFVGSGASMDVKQNLFPSWEVLLQKLADKLRDEADEDTAKIVLLQLKKKQLNKAADEAVDALKTHHFHQVMKSTFEIDRPVDANLALPQAIWSLKPSVVVTTNYERVLEWGGPASKFVVNSQRANLNSLFQESTVDSPKVWHLHGHISDPDSLILAPKHYEAFYGDEKHDNHTLAHAHARLRSMISQYPILFIGFGLRDEYVLEALQKVLKIFGHSLQPSYALLKQGDDRAQMLWQQYNVQVIPYADHGQPLVDKITEIRTEAEKLSMGGLPDATVPQPIPDSYIQWQRDQCVYITPFGMAPTDGQSVSLQQVYVPPVTMPRIAAEEPGMDDAGEAGDVVLRGRKRRDEAENEKSELFERESKETLQLLLHRLGEESLYVSGDPGAGKSTFCRWVSWLVCAGALPAFQVEAPEEFQEVFPEALRGRLPLVVRLREFQASLPQQPGRKSLTRTELEQALKAWLQATKPGGLTWEAVSGRLQTGTLLLILDGVDELALSAGAGTHAWSPRESVVVGVANAVPEWTKLGNRLLVTSRPYGLEADQIRLFERCGLPEAGMKRLPEPLQNLLASRWFVALPKTSAMGRELAKEMLRQVRQLSLDVHELAGNPLFLTAICIIYGEGKQLPADVHDLYDRIVKTSLHSRYPRDPRQIDPVRARLAAVAVGMHTGHPFETTRTVPKPEVGFTELNQILAQYIGANPETESGFRTQVEAREDLLNHSGLLLQGKPEHAGFYHLSFQEFLAAEQLTRVNEGVDKLYDVFRERAAVLNWRLTLRFLLARRATVQGPQAVLELLKRLLDTIDLNAINVSAGMALTVLDGLTILLDRKLQLQQPLLQHFTDVCVRAVEQQIEVKARLELALMLGRIGDPCVPDRLDDARAWVTVPADDYVYGQGNQSIKIERDFQLSKFPVTNAQYAGFVADGYRDPTVWHPVGWQWRLERNVTQPVYWNDARWNGPTCPVVGVSWWEADAFSRWAKVRLPSEQEWEAAARGPQGFQYPWGNTSDNTSDNTWLAKYCNSSELGLQRTNPVGMFPAAASPCGAYDMAGNVWEWCADHYEPGRKDNDGAGRVLRGGSWLVPADGCRSSIRVHDRPDDRYVDVGFRVARTS
ncbi:MAG: SUMF1/EgtB/PvdO family nonheme iron enzyme [Planctomycetia bacterium]